jgi:hypothetical protein
MYFKDNNSQSAKSKQTEQSKSLRPSQLQMPRKNHRHDIQNQVRRQHDDRVKPKEYAYIYAVTRHGRIPRLVDRPALEDVDKDAAETKTKGNEVHKPDAAVIFGFAHDLGVKEEERVFDGPVAEEVEHTRRQEKLAFCVSGTAYKDMDGRMENVP